LEMEMIVVCFHDCCSRVRVRELLNKADLNISVYGQTWNMGQGSFLSCGLFKPFLTTESTLIMLVHPGLGR